MTAAERESRMWLIGLIAAPIVWWAAFMIATWWPF